MWQVDATVWGCVGMPSSVSIRHAMHATLSCFLAFFFATLVCGTGWQGANVCVVCVPCSQGGIIYANAITTVSPTYASDIMNAGAGSFLKPVFNQDHVRPATACTPCHVHHHVPCHAPCHKLPASMISLS